MEDKVFEVADGLTWKEKYELSENQLNQFRKKVAQVRELFNEKISHYETRVVTAEKKCDEAQQVSEKLTLACQDKDEAISALREKISRMRDERNELIAQDEFKMQKIKEWVRVKFKEMVDEVDALKKEKMELRSEIGKGKPERGRKTDSAHLYEEVFGSLMDDLEATTYESLSKYQSNNDTPIPPSSPPEERSPPPAIPPRRASMRVTSRPIVKKKPKKKFSLFGSAERPNLHNSVESLNEQFDPIINESAEKRNSVFYYTILGSVSGYEFLEETKAPVYSTLKGKDQLERGARYRSASMIQKSPFTGDTSGSDSEEEGEMLRRNTAPTQLRTCAPYTAQNMKQETLEKVGWLTKLGGRVKNWKRRWFTLCDGKLSYFKTRGNMYGKPLGVIVLQTVSQISKSEQLFTIELMTSLRTYYLTADNKNDVDDWLRVLRNSLKRFSGVRLMSRSGEDIIYSGWATKAKCGTSKLCFAALKEKSLVFYKDDTENSSTLSTLVLREIVSVKPVVETVHCEGSVSDFEDGFKFTIECVKTPHPTYMMVATHAEMEHWINHLHVMCSGSESGTETPFEQLVTKLMHVDGDSSSRYWKNRLLIHSKSLLKESLSSLTTPELRKKALNLWKSIQLFSNTPINDSAVDYHVTLAQDIVQLCLTHPELQTEYYCQLIKQTTKYRSGPVVGGGGSYTQSNDWLGGGVGSTDTIDMNPVSSSVYLQCWQLIALGSSIFLPKLNILWLLKAHIHRHMNESSDNGRYAIYCQRSLERMLANGERETKPSRVEVLALISRNPYYRLYPMSAPVYFVDNTYQVFSFDGSTTVSELSEMINEEMGIRENNESGFALYTDNPVSQFEHCLQSELKICDAISKWEQASQHLKTGRFERSNAIKLTYKNRLFFMSIAKRMSDKERYLHVFQVAEHIRIAHLIPTANTLAKITALMAQIEYGDYVDQFKMLDEVLSLRHPVYSSLTNVATKRRIFKNVADIWSSLKGRELNECCQTYTSIVKSIPLYGSKLFQAQEKLQQVATDIWIAVSEIKIMFLNPKMEATCEYSWADVITFGGYKQDFMLVVQHAQDEKTTRRLFAMPPGRVQEVTFLIASYINALVAKCGVSLDSRPDGEGAPTNDVIEVWTR